MNNPRTYWDYIVQDGKTYQMGPQSHRVFLLDLLVKKGVTSILDVGCGTGPIYQLLKNDQKDPSPRWNAIENYKGTDYAEGMIDVCKKEFPEGNWGVEDMRNLKEEDNSWDCVLLMHAIDHTDDYQKAIEEAARVASKYVLIVLWRGINYNPGAVNNLNNRSRYGKKDNEPDWEDTHLMDFAWEPLREALDKAGLNLLLKEEGEIVNKEGKHNTVLLLEKC